MIPKCTYDLFPPMCFGCDRSSIEYRSFQFLFPLIYCQLFFPPSPSPSLFPRPSPSPFPCPFAFSPPPLTCSPFSFPPPLPSLFPQHHFPMHPLPFRPFRPFHLFLLLLSILFYNRIRRILHIQSFLAEQSAQLREKEMAEFVEPFKKAIEKVGNDSPAIVLLNKHALNITLNFVCNLRLFPGAAERLIAVVFDRNSEIVLRSSFPHLNVIHWPLMALADKFAAGDGRYQLFQYFRAKLAAFLTELVHSFWMVQADTIWRQNLFKIIDVDNATDEFRRADLIFDSEGNDGLLRSMIAGGYFFVRSSVRTRSFFESVSHFLLDHFSTDNNVMARQCLLGIHGIKCAQIPYRILSNWRHSYEGNKTGDDPALFQFDGGDSAGVKFEKMRAEGHLFVDPNTIGEWNYAEESAAKKGTNQRGKVRCDERMREQREGRGTKGQRQPWRAAEKRAEKRRPNRTLAAIHALFEWTNAIFPGIKRFLIAELFPRYAAHFFI